MTKRSDKHQATVDDRRPTGRENFRDTADSIVVAFILAFVFRAFVVEAFVIPTGSMAPTLYGRHGSMCCESCGYTFAYGLRDAGNSGRGPVHGANSKALCPNCSRLNTNLVQNDKAGNSEAGDRILVLKWPLDIGGARLSTQRWNVMVFKDPSDGMTNYIKRIVGLPEEVLSIIDGDVYTVPIAELSDASRQILFDLVKRKTELQYGTKRGRLERVPTQVLDELDGKLRIPRKTSVAQRSLWFNVYNHDYQPKKLVRGPPRWVASGTEGSAWDTTRRAVVFDGVGKPPEFIKLHNGLTADAYAYNLKGPRPMRSLNPVEDLRVRFVLSPQSTSGSVRVQLAKRGRVFTATIGMDGSLSISAEEKGQSLREFDSLKTSRAGLFSSQKAVEVAFEIVDYRASLWVGGEEILATTDEQFSPDIKTLRQGARSVTIAPRVCGDSAAFELMHLVVERDVYYRDPGQDALRSAIGNWCDDQSMWGSPSKPILLRQGEYFALGDNSPQSQDSRLWTQIGPHLRDRGERFQLATIPEDQLVGRAFFVYWPSGRRLGDWLPGLGKIGIIPNVGRMRWIR